MYNKKEIMIVLTPLVLIGFFNVISDAPGIKELLITFSLFAGVTLLDIGLLSVEKPQIIRFCVSAILLSLTCALHPTIAFAFTVALLFFLKNDEKEDLLLFYFFTGLLLITTSSANYVKYVLELIN